MVLPCSVVTAVWMGRGRLLVPGSLQLLVGSLFEALWSAGKAGQLSWGEWPFGSRWQTPCLLSPSGHSEAAWAWVPRVHMLPHGGRISSLLLLTSKVGSDTQEAAKFFKPRLRISDRQVHFQL